MGEAAGEVTGWEDRPKGDDLEAEDPEVEQLVGEIEVTRIEMTGTCLLYTSPSPRDISGSRMPSSA